MKDLLLLLSRYPYDTSNRETLSDLLGEVQNWPKLVELINAHGIIALAAYNIKEARLEKKVPFDSMSILENGYLQSVVRNIWLTEHWKEVNTILVNAGIKHVLLKGMALEHTIYESGGLRQMTDNDILVKPEDALKSWTLLKRYGFSHGPVKSELHKKILPFIGKHLPTLYKNGYAIEIHHRLFDNENNPETGNNDPVNDAVEILVNDTNAWILSKEMQLRHLVSHFKRHAIEGSVQIRQYADILLLDKNSNVTMPDEFIDEPQQTYRSAYMKAAYKKGYLSVPERYRLRFLIGDIFPSLTWMKQRYNCGRLKAILHYPFRVAKLVWLIS
jgi:hypothetical protein